MKKTRSLICVLLIACVMLSLTVSASAAAPQYKVTISSGLHGTIGGERTIEVTVPSGGSVNYLDYIPTAVDEFYYFKGFHISGQEGVAPPSTIDRDLQIVASYGIEGDMAQITVHYRTADGRALANDDVLKGKIGDKPVVPARHIDNYVPNAYNFTFTLTGDREVTFTYTPVPQQQNNNQNNNQNNQNNNQNNPAVPPNQPEVPPNQPENQNNQGDNTQGTEAPAGPTEPENNNPPEIVDLDNQDVPLAGPGGSSDGTVGTETQQAKKGARTALTIGLIGLLGLIAALVYLLSRRKKKEQ